MSDETIRKDGSRSIRQAFSVDSATVNQDKAQCYEFGPFRLDSSERKLMRGNEMVPLTPKAFDTLLLLVRNSGHLMEKDQLLTLLWPDSFVEEGSLSNNIFLLRKVLGEDPAFIETVPRRGYRFAGAVRQLRAAAEQPLEKPRDPDREVATKVPGDPRRPDRSVGISSAAKVRSLSRTLSAITVGAAVLLAIGAFIWLRSTSRLPDRSQWIPLTKLPDAVSQPALSPDGRMLAFILSDSSFIAHGQIYVKMLPDGQPVELTHDDLLKMSPVFSPDGGRIAYTTIDAQFNWDTWAVPTLRGEPQPWLRNASGLAWSGPHHVVFSKMRKPPHMGVAVAEESRIGERDVYVPPVEPGMVHRSYPSPDGKSVLLVEMDQDHSWVPCRLVPMDGTSLGHKVGPPRDACTFAAWSPDGKWMYFTSEAGGSNHIWRQRYPDGQAQQITSGPTEQEGIAMAPDGRSFVTAVTLANVSVWLHDAKGERQISLEGNAADPRFTPDGRKLCYRVVTKAPNEFQFSREAGEVWQADLDSGHSAPLARGLPALAYDISADGRQVVLETEDQDGKPRLWLMSFEPQSAPQRVPNVEGRQPRFGPTGEIFFRGTDGFVYRVRPDGTGIQKAFEQAVDLLSSISPDARWIVAWTRLPGSEHSAFYAFSMEGGTPIRLGDRISCKWSPSGGSLSLADLSFAHGRTYIIPLRPHMTLPPIPPGGFQSERELTSMPGAYSTDAKGVVPGPSLEVYAFFRSTTQRNLYRIPIP